MKWTVELNTDAMFTFDSKHKKMLKMPGEIETKELKL